MVFKMGSGAMINISDIMKMGLDMENLMKGIHST
jgi:hypothetical protein